MLKNKSKSKLVLRSSVVAVLTGDRLSAVKGGMEAYTPKSCENCDTGTGIPTCPYP